MFVNPNEYQVLDLRLSHAHIIHGQLNVFMHLFTLLPATQLFTFMEITSTSLSTTEKLQQQHSKNILQY